jgi:hypothetical protein
MIINNLNKGAKQFGGDVFTTAIYGALIPFGSWCAPIKINLKQALSTIHNFTGPVTGALKAANLNASLEGLVRATTEPEQKYRLDECL